MFTHQRRSALLQHIDVDGACEPSRCISAPQCSLKDLPAEDIIEELQLRWFGHVVRMEEDRLAKMVHEDKRKTWEGSLTEEGWNGKGEEGWDRR
ncbi:unnamed protein product [Nezara viridula]|uniref:Uncharacterized protein n=1 Tax=Nezara viridula TaxID=85310 RepID=A0A9P0E2M1_NEZVI|nr:unnamed protein product [Nezara viridula]